MSNDEEKDEKLEETIKAVAKQMKDNNCAIEDIVKYTKLSKEEIEKL